MDGSHYGMLLWELDDDGRAVGQPRFMAGLPLMLALVLLTLTLLITCGHAAPVIEGL